MLTKLLQWASVATLMVGLIFWRSSANYRVILRFTVCSAACLVALKAKRANQYYWAAAFFALALLFNPVVPVSLPVVVFVWVDALCLTIFLLSIPLFWTGRHPSRVSLHS